MTVFLMAMTLTKLPSDSRETKCSLSDTAAYKSRKAAVTRQGGHFGGMAEVTSAINRRNELKYSGVLIRASRRSYNWSYNATP
jgi:hypothetical protein